MFTNFYVIIDKGIDKGTGLLSSLFDDANPVPLNIDSIFL